MGVHKDGFDWNKTKVQSERTKIHPDLSLGASPLPCPQHLSIKYFPGLLPRDYL